MNTNLGNIFSVDDAISGIRIVPRSRAELPFFQAVVRPVFTSFSCNFFDSGHQK